MMCKVIGFGTFGLRCHKPKMVLILSTNFVAFLLNNISFAEMDKLFIIPIKPTKHRFNMF